MSSECQLVNNQLGKEVSSDSLGLFFVCGTSHIQWQAPVLDVSADR